MASNNFEPIKNQYGLPKNQRRKWKYDCESKTELYIVHEKVNREQYQCKENTSLMDFTNCTFNELMSTVSQKE